VYQEGELLPISALQHLLFCERRAALIFLEGLWQDNTYTAQGSLLHEQAHQATVECRDDWRIVRGLWLRSLELGLYGRADVVEFRRTQRETTLTVPLPGLAGLWQPFPVEYKSGRLRREESFEVQLCAQAMCLEEMLGVLVPAGAVYYGKTRRRLELEFTPSLREKTRATARRLHELITTGKTPHAVFRKKCRSCSLVGICLPTAMSHKKSVRRYLKQAMERGEDEAPA